MCILCDLTGSKLHSKSIHESIDAEASTSTSYSLSVGDVFNGDLAIEDDRDWIEIELIEGNSYEFELTGSPSSHGTLTDPYLRFYNSDGVMLNENDDDGTGFEAYLFYNASYTGIYYLSAGSYKDNSSGTYRLTTASYEPERDFGEFSPNSSITSSTWSGIDSDNDYVKGLMWGCKWGAANPENTTTEINYYIYDNEKTLGNYTAGRLKAEEEKGYIDAMNAYSSVANLTFTEGNSAEDSHILWASLNNNQSDGALGWAAPPDISNSDNNSYGDPAGLTTQNWKEYSSRSQVDDTSILLPGSFYFITTIHELGHSLGLAHPHDNLFNFPGVNNSSNQGDNGLNAAPFTVMTYNDIGANSYVPDSYAYSGFLETLGAFDIAAIQYLYGPNTNHNIGNDIYTLNELDLNGWRCIWDNGGTDTITAESSLKFVNIDLRNASLKNQVGGGGYVSQVGAESHGYTIAFNSTGNCVIENAIGSNFNDFLKGNNYANKLSGGDGKDKLFGEAGNDFLNGGKGNDKLIGGSGRDTAIFSSSNNKIDLAITERQLTGEGKDFFSSIENVKGGDGNDLIYGDVGNNYLYGEAGKDELYGRAGNDKLYGEARNDKLFGEEGNDLLTGGLGNDQLTGGAGRDKFCINTGPGKDVITDYGRGNDRIKLLAGLTDNDLKINQAGNNVRIKYEDDLLAIVQNTLADDLTFI